MKPKVFIIIDTGAIGGPGKGLFQFLRSSRAAQLDYLICNFEYNRQVSTGFAEYARANGYRLALLRERFRFDPSTLWQAWKLLKAGGFNLIQSHNYKSHVLAFLLARLSGLPWIAMSHGWTTEDWKVRLYHSIDRLLLPYADRVIAVSPLLHKSISALRGPSRATDLIFNAIESEQAPDRQSGLQLRSSLGIAADTLLIGCFGRLSSEKGQGVLLKAFQQVRAAKANAHLLFAGNGPDREKLERESSSLQLNANVTFAGFQTEMRKFYGAIDLLVLPSLSEGLPNVVLEALASNVPVLSTDVGAVREIITEGENGWIVPANDAAVLAERLLRLTTDRELLSLVASRSRASLFPRFSAEERAAKLFSAYEQTLAQKLPKMSLISPL